MKRLTVWPTIFDRQWRESWQISFRKTPRSVQMSGGPQAGIAKDNLGWVIDRKAEQSNLATAIGRIGHPVHFLTIQEEGQRTPLSHHTDRDRRLSIGLERRKHRRLRGKLPHQSEMVVRRQVMMPVETNIEVVEIALLKV